MINILKEEIFSIYITPNDLRKIADDLEKQWKKVKLGCEVPTYKISDNNITIELTIDQERMK